MNEIKVEKGSWGGYKIIYDGKKLGGVYMNDDGKVKSNTFKKGIALPDDIIAQVEKEVKAFEEAQPPRWLTFIKTIGLIAFVVWGIGSISSRSDEMKVEREQERKQYEKSAIYKGIKNKGWHCSADVDPNLGGDGFYTYNLSVKVTLRDPESFRHVRTTISPISDGKHIVYVTYRAKNGFGGFDNGKTKIYIRNSDCGIISVSNA